MKRFTDWRARLSALIEARRRVPADATNNCGLFVADAILAMTGNDIAWGFRRPFVTLEEAVAALRADGYADVCAFFASYFEEIHPSQARAGDVMAFPSEETGWAVGIVNGERVTVLRPDGLGTVLRSLGDRAFRVP